MLRLFAAIAPPPDLRERLEFLQRGLPGRRVAPENLHLTLAFFGEIAEPVAVDLHAALSAIDAPRFWVTLDGAGAFGGAKPKLIYAAVRPEPALDHLRAKVLQAARGAGLDIPAERYTPHVTLSRIAPGTVSSAEAAKALAARAAFLVGPVAVEAFHIYRSHLGRAGPSYAELATYALR